MAKEMCVCANKGELAEQMLCLLKLSLLIMRVHIIVFLRVLSLFCFVKLGCH